MLTYRKFRCSNGNPPENINPPLISPDLRLNFAKGYFITYEILFIIADCVSSFGRSKQIVRSRKQLKMELQTKTCKNFTMFKNKNCTFVKVVPAYNLFELLN